MTPQITAIYAALLALWLLLLAWRIVLLRRKHQVGIGAGGVSQLSVAIRCHANATEYVPMALLLLLLAELQQAPEALLHVAGVVLLVGRIFHAQGLTKTQGGVSFGRVVGTSATWLVMLVLAIVNLLLVIL